MTITESKTQGRVLPRPEAGLSKDMHPLEDIVAYLRRYARDNPQSAALTCLAIGFVLGWKLKPW